MSTTIDEIARRPTATGAGARPRTAVGTAGPPVTPEQHPPDEEVVVTSPGNSDEDPDDRPLDTVPADQDPQDDREAADPTPDDGSG